jgi:hypothetical protein
LEGVSRLLKRRKTTLLIVKVRLRLTLLVTMILNVFWFFIMLLNVRFWPIRKIMRKRRCHH